MSIDDNYLMRAVRARVLIRPQRGIYVLGASWRPASPEDRYRLRVSATLHALRQAGTPARASHHAAVALAGLPLFGVDLTTVDVMLEGPSRSRVFAGIRRHPIPARLSGTTALPVSDALVLVAKSSGTVAATVSADAALHGGVVQHSTLLAAVQADRARRRLLPWLDGLDAKSESVGESRLRLILRDGGFRPATQVVIRLGQRAYRVDFLIGDRLIIEFDGLVKYGGATGREALAQEKAREELLVRAGFSVVRVIWAELDDPAALYARIATAESRRRRAG